MRLAQDAAARGGDGKISNHNGAFLLMLPYFTFGRTKRKTDATIWYALNITFLSRAGGLHRRKIESEMRLPPGPKCGIIPP